MAGISAFPLVPDTVHGAFGTEVTKKAYSDVLAGQVVQINSDGLVLPATASTQKIIGNQGPDPGGHGRRSGAV